MNASFSYYGTTKKNKRERQQIKTNYANDDCSVVDNSSLDSYCYGCNTNKRTVVIMVSLALLLNASYKREREKKKKCLQNIKTASSCSIVDIENKNYQGLNTTNYAQKVFYTNIRIQIKMDVKYHPAIIFLVNKY